MNNKKQRYDIFKIRKVNGKCVFEDSYDVELDYYDLCRYKDCKINNIEVYYNSSNVYTIYAEHGSMTKEDAIQKLKKFVKESVEKRIALVNLEIARLNGYLFSLESI